MKNDVKREGANSMDLEGWIQVSMGRVLRGLKYKEKVFALHIFFFWGGSLLA